MKINLMLRILVIVAAIISCQSILRATSIAPFRDLGELISASDLVLTVRAKDVLIDSSTLVEYSIQTFDVLEVLKGDYGNKSIQFPYLSNKIGALVKKISYDYDFVADNEYLLFLVYHNGVYMPLCVSYYIYEQVNFKGKQYFRPNSIEAPQIISERIFEIPNVMDKAKFIDELNKRFKKPWDKSHYQIDSKVANEITKNSLHKTNHCSPFLYDFNGTLYRTRWQNNENDTLPIAYQSNNTSGCTDIHDQVNNAIDYMSSEYTGVKIKMDETFSGYTSNCDYTPSSPNVGDPVHSEYQTYMNQNYPGGQAILIQFDDPCNTIPNLVNCSGTLAYGGAYASNSIFNYNGLNWAPSLYGFVVFNESTGSCTCNNNSNVPNVSEYGIILVHELTHALGFGHISAGFGAANMNPFCCSSITNLDIACVDVAYVPPGYTCSDGQQNGNETGVDCGGPDCDPCPTCSDGIQNQGETGVDCGGPCSACPTCMDNIQNQGEVAVDCGGPCAACIYGCSSVTNAHNYESNPDIEETCETCSDNIQNGDETGVDCGGSNPVCVACPCLEVFASNYNMPGPCVYDCDASNTTVITDGIANDTIISGANTMSTNDMSPVDVDMVGPYYWRARQSIELNGGFTIQAGSSLTIDVGDCDN